MQAFSGGTNSSNRDSRRLHVVLLAFVAASAVTTAACGQANSATAGTSSEPTATASSCAPLGGGRCAGPEAVTDAIVGQLSADSAGTTISGRFQCGGELTASETSSHVVLTYVASAVTAGGMACAVVPLSVQLKAPLGSRTLIDGVSGGQLDVAPGSASS